MNTDKPTYKEMQEMLPDYVFSKLSDSKKEVFEANLSDYPDLQKEVTDAKAVFARLDKMEIDKEINYRTKNISYLVRERIASQNSTRTGQKRFVFHMAMPIMALLAFAIYTFIIPNNDIQTESEIITFEEHEIQEILQNDDNDDINIQNQMEYYEGLYQDQDMNDIDLEGITEDDFQELLEEIEDEDIIS